VADDVLTPEEVRKARSILGGLTTAEWRALKALASGLVSAMGSGGSAGGNGAAPATGGDELPDRFLDSQAWSNKRISKDPKRWAGESMRGLLCSQIPSDWHEVQAEALEYKAQKGREDPEPRLQTKGKNAGKPWHEADAFEAKIHRAWARRNLDKKLPPPRNADAEDELNELSGTPTGSDANEDWVP
jgi:hypothetical protein